MELLVRLTDKINIQVFCLNPEHKGNHMDRVVFDDPTFGAPCPECSKLDWLYRKNNAVSKKGHFITYKPDGWSWGTNERKHYGIVRINCTEEEAVIWCESIDNEEAKVDSIKYVDDEEKRMLAKNLVDITHRHRKLALDFEKVLTVDELKDWNNRGKYSPIVTISEQDEAEIKEVL